MINIEANNSDFQSASFQYLVVKNLGLCVPLTDYLTLAIGANAITQILVSVTGIVGAALSLKVTSLRQKRSPLSVQVSVLSIYDILFLFAVLLLAILRLCNVYNHAMNGVFHVVRVLGLWGVTYTMVDITIDRCLYIACPFLAKRVCGVRFTLKRSAAILVVGICFTLPFALDLINNFSSKSCTEERRLTVYGVVYTLYISILFLYLIPILGIVIANLILIRALRRFRKQTQVRVTNTPAQTDNSAKHLAIFVMGINAWYVLCMITPAILFLVRLSRAEVFRPERAIVAASTADTLIVLSTAANFVFYFLMWKNFRHIFLAMFCSRCCGSKHYSVSGTERKIGHHEDINLHSPVTASFDTDNVIEK